MKPKKSVYKPGAPFLPNLIGSGFGSGYWPWGPGTAGALLALLIWFGLSILLIDPYLKLITLLLVSVFYVAGVWASNKLEPFWGEDPSRVVIDEVVGVWISLLAAPAGSIIYGIAAFCLFRFFDIVKPMGVRHMEGMGQGHGVMMDDVLAGIYGFLVLYVVQNILIPIWA